MPFNYTYMQALPKQITNNCATNFILNSCPKIVDMLHLGLLYALSKCISQLPRIHYNIEPPPARPNETAAINQL